MLKFCHSRIRWLLVPKIPLGITGSWASSSEFSRWSLTSHSSAIDLDIDQNRSLSFVLPVHSYIIKSFSSCKWSDVYCNTTSFLSCEGYTKSGGVMTPTIAIKKQQKFCECIARGKRLSVLIKLIFVFLKSEGINNIQALCENSRGSIRTIEKKNREGSMWRTIASIMNSFHPLKKKKIRQM